jgi:hypothetical protein
MVVGHILEIVPQFLTLGEIIVPIMVGLKRIGIKMVGRIDAAARIGIFKPGAANGWALFPVKL